MKVSNKEYQYREGSSSPISPFIENKSTDSQELTDTCRICLETATAKNPFCHPCLCTGSSRYVHITCLQRWRAQHSTTHEAYKKCMECGYTYQTRPGAYSVNIYTLSVRVVRSPCSFITLLFAISVCVGYLLEQIPGFQDKIDQFNSSLHFGGDGPDLSFIPSLLCGIITYVGSLRLLSAMGDTIVDTTPQKLRYVITFYFAVFFVINYLIGAMALIGFAYVTVEIVVKYLKDEIMRRSIPADDIINYPHTSSEITHGSDPIHQV